MLRYFKVFGKLFKASLMAEMEYKANFLSSFVFINIWLAINVLFYKSMYSHISYLGDWNENQTLFFVAAFNLVDSLFFLLFFKGIFGLQTSINQGTYDYTLVKPFSKSFLTFFNSFDISRIINIVFSLILFLITLQNVNFSALNFFLFLLMMVNGLVIYASVFLIINTLSFYIINAYSVFVMFFDIMEFARMPLVSATGIVRMIFMFIFPILFIAGVPCEFLFRGNYVFVIASTIVAILFGIFSIWFLNFSVKRYSSASS